MQLSSVTVDFYLFYDGPVDKPFRQEVSVECLLLR